MNPAVRQNQVERIGLPGVQLDRIIQRYFRGRRCSNASPHPTTGAIRVSGFKDCAGLEGFSLYPGAVFKTTDPNRAGRRMGGRIRAATATEVTLDDAVELDAGQAYTLNL